MYIYIYIILVDAVCISYSIKPVRKGMNLITRCGRKI